MKISCEGISYITKLARLKLTKIEQERLTKDMTNILEFVDKINQLDTEGVTPTSHAVHINNVFRDDIIEESYDKEKILANAPEKENDFFKVPKIVE
jgi:aspartyl-tRNA(Asn)/glutamyl-tRNA(Gln) amidotransferase subunit C